MRPSTRPLVLAALLTGCLTTPVQRVETLGAGNYEIAIEGGTSVVSDANPVPAANLAVRMGVSDGVDLGVRVGTWAYEVQSKILLTPPHATTPVSLAPSTSVIHGPDPFDSSANPDEFTLVFLRTPVLVGIPVAGEHQLVLGPGVNTVFGFEGGRTQVALEGRMSVGFSARLGSALRLHPEVAVGIGGLTVGSQGTELTGPSARVSAVAGLAVGNAY